MNVVFDVARGGVDAEGKFKKSLTFVHEGGVREFVELLCKEKASLHPDMKVRLSYGAPLNLRLASYV